VKATLPVVYDAGDFVLSSFRDRVGASAPILETEARIERIVAGLRSCEHVRWSSAASAYDQALGVVSRVHSSEYLWFLAATSERAEGEVIEARFAEAGVVPDTPVTKGAYPAAIRAVASAVAAANQLVRGERQAYAVCRPPGHHAGRAFMGGYCFLNNACAAARVLRDAGKRVGVVDVDYHHGNGTADILATEDDVPFVSLHASTITAFPYIETTPRAANQTFVAFEDPPSEDVYLVQLAEQLGSLSKVDAIVVSLGYDPVIGDPHGGWAMTPGFFQRAARLFKETTHQLCFVQEGGYGLERLAECSRELAMGLE
jgi:acetoin utilization deacetylase AcuC-like enzyme